MNNMKCGLYIYNMLPERHKNTRVAIYEQHQHGWRVLAVYERPYECVAFTITHITRGRLSFCDVRDLDRGAGILWLGSDRTFHVKQDQP